MRRNHSNCGSPFGYFLPPWLVEVLRDSRGVSTGDPVKRVFSLMFIFAALFAVMLTSGCGGGGSAPIVVTLSSTATQTDAVQGLTVNITATVQNDVSDDGVGWTLTGPGSLSSQAGASITYNAPANVTSAVTATITATSVAAPSISARLRSP